MPSNQGLEIPVDAEPAAGDRDRDVAAELPELPYVRWSQRPPAPRDRRRPWLVLALVLAAHAAAVWLGYVILRPPPLAPARSDVITISLVKPNALPPPPSLVAPPPLPGQPPPPPRRVPYEAPAKGAIRATLEGTPPPRLELYTPSGAIRLPPASAPPASAPAYSAQLPQSSRIYSGKSPVPYKPTQFNQDWAPLNESLGAKTVGRAVDKIIDKTTVQKDVKLPGDIRIRCVLSPLALIAGCGGEPPQPPPKNDNDVRLSMPPPQTLTGKKVVVPSSAASVPPPSDRPRD